jgi:putative ABC transport system permease protein
MREFVVSIKLAFSNLRGNVGRTVLTLVGVVIGITSVIVITASGQGVKSYILGQISSFGTDVIQIETKVPNTGKNSAENAGGQAMGIQITTLKIDDADAIKKLPNVAEDYAGTINQQIVSFRENNKTALIFGASASVPIVDPGVKVAEGSFYTEADDKSLAQVIVIGPDIKSALFGSGDAIGQEVKMNGQNYKVVGVLEKRGTITFFNFDEIIYIPVRTLQKKILGVDYIRTITVKVDDTNLMDATIADITDLVRRQHSITDSSKDDFSVTSIKEAQDTIASVFATINILLLALTSISLVVGGVGIMNVMYVAVVERTFEIGLRKAVGAGSGDILKQFLFEAIFITLAGGVVGIILGFLLSFVFSYVFQLLGYGIKFQITWQALALAVGFSVAVGIIFGYYPARRASQLSPMEALRKE